MKPLYELWDTEDSNLIGSFNTEEEALAAVRTATEQYGLQAMATVALGYECETGQTTPVAAGRDLVALALYGRNEGLVASA